jgi:hypothetical protein
MTKRKQREISPEIVDRLKGLYETATAGQLASGLVWYQEAHEYAVALAAKHGTSPSVVCAVIAALSPGANWDHNKNDADVFLSCFFLKKLRGQKLPSVGSYGWRNIEKAERICKGEAPLDVLGGNKVRAFYVCLLLPESSKSVCIDRHAKCAAIGQYLGDTVVTPSEYSWIESHYRIAALDLGLVPSQLQAICWVVWRETYQNYFPVDVELKEEVVV